jgi:hypothetical protein
MTAGSSIQAMMRTAAGRPGLDVDPDQIAWSALEQPQAGPKGGGQDARSNTRFRRCAPVIEARCAARRHHGNG